MTLLQGEASDFSASKSMPFPMEKVFPVYAMGLFKGNVGGDVSCEISDSAVGDPIWDAVREKAKLEVVFFGFLSIFWSVQVVLMMGFSYFNDFFFSICQLFQKFGDVNFVCRSHVWFNSVWLFV